MSNELHLLYLLTPIITDFRVDWNKFELVYNNLFKDELKICDLIGIDPDFIS